MNHLDSLNPLRRRAEARELRNSLDIRDRQREHTRRAALESEQIPADLLDQMRERVSAIVAEKNFDWTRGFKVIASKFEGGKRVVEVCPSSEGLKITTNGLELTAGFGQDRFTGKIDFTERVIPYEGNPKVRAGTTLLQEGGFQKSESWPVSTRISDFRQVSSVLHDEGAYIIGHPPTTPTS